MSWTHPESTLRKERTSDALAIQLPSSSHRCAENAFAPPQQMLTIIDTNGNKVYNNKQQKNK